MTVKRCASTDAHPDHDWYSRDPAGWLRCPGWVGAEFEYLLDEFIADNYETLRRLASGPGSVPS